MTWAEQLKAARAKISLTQEQLARWCGVTERTVQLWEAGKVRPRLQAADRLCRMLKLAKKTFKA